MRPRSTTTSGEATRTFITLTRLWPPASARAFSWPERRRTASSTDSGRAYSTSLSSTALSLKRLRGSGRAHLPLLLQLPDHLLELLEVLHDVLQLRDQLRLRDLDLPD